MNTNDKSGWISVEGDVIFYIMDKQEMRTIAIQEKFPESYHGHSYKEHNTGWEINPITVGRTACEILIKEGSYELTKNKTEAMAFCSLKPKTND